MVRFWTEEQNRRRAVLETSSSSRTAVLETSSNEPLFSEQKNRTASGSWNKQPLFSSWTKKQEPLFLFQELKEGFVSKRSTRKTRNKGCLFQEPLFFCLFQEPLKESNLLFFCFGQKRRRRAVALLEELLVSRSALLLLVSRTAQRITQLFVSRKRRNTKQEDKSQVSFSKKTGVVQEDQEPGVVRKNQVLFRKTRNQEPGTTLLVVSC